MKHTLFLSLFLFLACSKEHSSGNKEEVTMNNPSQTVKAPATTSETQTTSIPASSTPPADSTISSTPNTTTGVEVPASNGPINDTELEIIYDLKTQTHVVKRPRELILSIQKPQLLSGNNYLCYQLNYFREYEERIAQVRNYALKLELRTTNKTKEQSKLKEKLDQQWRSLGRKEKNEIEKRIERLNEEIEQLQGDFENANYKISTLLERQNESREVLSTEGGTSQINISPNYKSIYNKIVENNPSFRFTQESLPKDLKTEFSTKIYAGTELENILTNAKKIFGIKNKRNITYISQIPESDFLIEKVSLFSTCPYEPIEENQVLWESNVKLDVKIKLDF